MSTQDSCDSIESLAQTSPKKIEILGEDLAALFHDDDLASKVDELFNRTPLSLSKIPAHLRFIVETCDLIMA